MFQVADVSAGLLIISHGNFQSFGKANDAVYIFCSRSHISFLSAAKNERPYIDVFIYIQDTYAFGPMKFMTGRRNKMDIEFAKVHRIVPNGLHTIGVKNSSILLTKLAYFFYGQQHTDLVIGMHKRNQA